MRQKHLLMLTLSAALAWVSLTGCTTTKTSESDGVTIQKTQSRTWNPLTW